MPESIELPFCPQCGEKSFKHGSFKPWTCTSCDFKIYPNVAAAAGVFIFNEYNEVLFNERAHEPSKGKLGLPGGFLDPGESAEKGVAREVMEEVGLQTADLKYLCSFPNRYYFGGIWYDTLDIFFTARATSKEIELDPAEVTAIHWLNPRTVSAEEIAFPSYMQALEVLITALGD